MFLNHSGEVSGISKGSAMVSTIFAPDSSGVLVADFFLTGVSTPELDDPVLFLALLVLRCVRSLFEPPGIVAKGGPHIPLTRKCFKSCVFLIKLILYHCCPYFMHVSHQLYILTVVALLINLYQSHKQRITF